MRLRMILLLAAFAATSMSAAPKKPKVEIPADVPKQFVGRDAVWLRSGLSEEYLVDRLKNIANDFVRGKSGRMLTVPECQSRTSELRKIAAYYFFETDCGISRKWMLKNVEFTEALTKAQSKLHFLILNKQTATDEYRQWYEYYRKTAGDFARRVAKPVKVKIADKKSLALQLKIKKAVLERELAAEQAKKESAVKLDDSKPSRKK